MKKEEIKKMVREGYAKIAKKDSSCCLPVNSCCGGTDLAPHSRTDLSQYSGSDLSRCAGPDVAQNISGRIGYTEEELNAVPEGANLGLGCGNPVALASLREGETILDLGCGAGFDCFLAADKVGKSGRVIGVDMTPEMIEKARENAQKGHYQNVEFRLGEIENLPVADNSIDVVISNCVINLSPDKQRVFQEAFRVLKPGGRLMVSDIVLLKELPVFIKKSVEAYIACISGAMMKDKYLEAIKAAGFQNVKIIDETSFPIECTTDDPPLKGIIEDLKITPEKVKEIASSVASIKVYGIKSKEKV